MVDATASAADIIGDLADRLAATRAQQKVLALMDWIERYWREDRPSLAEGACLDKAAIHAIELKRQGAPLTDHQQGLIDARQSWVVNHGMHHIERHAEMMRLKAEASDAVSRARSILVEAKALGLPINYELPVMPH